MRLVLLILHVARAQQQADDASSMLQVLKRTERLVEESVDGIYEDQDCTSGKCKPKCAVMECSCLEGQEHSVSQDVHGCNICECQGEPCQEPACEECPLAQKLIIGVDNRGCETCSCEGTLCPLELPTCSCLPGQDAVVKKDQNGCDQCGCEGEVCKEPKRTCARGQELVCQTNEKGCEICNCEGQICPLALPVCNCLTGQKRVNIKDQRGCDACECQGAACAEPDCPAKCPFAQKLVYGKDRRQCETCACKGKICPKKKACNCKLGQKLATKKDAHGCETCSCTGTPCAKPRCKPCPKAQKLRMKKDNRGCDTCSCEGSICGPPRPGTCQKGQTRETKTLPNGCPAWSCKGEPCKKPQCKACPLVQKLKLKKDSRGCETCSCEGVKCPVPNCKCSNSQKLWKGKSSNGCPICKCRDVECEACDLEKLCNDAITLKHDATNLAFSNLGGLGPNNKFAKEIRFKDAIRNYQGKRVDLVVVAKPGTGYTAFDQYQAAKLAKANPTYINANGAKGDFGNINMLPPAGKTMKPTFTFKFVERATDKPVVLPSVMFTFFDLDQAKTDPGGGEEISTCDADDVITAVGTQLKMIKKSGKCRVVQSTQNGIVNVQDKDKMTESQKKNSVVMQFTKKSSFDIQFFNRKGMRNFLFMAHPTFVCPDKKIR